MIRKQSIDERFATQSPQIDPAAAQWHNWAVKTSKQIEKEPTSSKQPNTPVMSPSQSSSTDYSSNQNIRGQPSVNAFITNKSSFNHNLEQDSNERKLFSDPPYCFCQKPAFRSESKEFGVVYDCHFISSTSTNSSLPSTNLTNTGSQQTTTHICGFHIHQKAWKRMGEAAKNKKPVDYNDTELATCPYFNFTFCVAFRVSNIFKKSSPRAPRCFCNRRVILSECDYKLERRLCFVCPNFYIDGARPKCSWFLWAEELAFNKPKYPRHSQQLLEDANSRIRQKKSPILTDQQTEDTSVHEIKHYIDQQHDQRPEYLPEQHSMHLLMTLEGTNLNSLKKYESIKGQYDSSTCDEKDDKNTDDESDINSNDLCYETQHNDLFDHMKSINQVSSPYLQSSNDRDKNKKETNNHMLYQTTLPYFLTADSTTSMRSSLLDMITYNNNQFVPISVRRKGLMKQHDYGLESKYTALQLGQDEDDVLEEKQSSVESKCAETEYLNAISCHSQFTPTTLGRSDLMKQQHKLDGVESRLFDSSSRYIDDLINNRSEIERMWNHINEQATMVEKLKNQDAERCHQMVQLQRKHDIMEQEIQHLKTGIEKEKQLLQENMNTEIALRQHNQQQLSYMEESLENLIEENTSLVMESRQKTLHPEPKCQVCYSANVDCALVPCFHSVYCLDCAHKLKECALCRIQKFGVQKIYLC